MPDYWCQSLLLFCTQVDRLFALADFIGHLGPNRCLCRQPPYDRSRPPIRHLDRARYGRDHTLELGRLRWDHSSIWHLGLRYGSVLSISHVIMYTFYLTPRKSLYLDIELDILYRHDNKRSTPALFDRTCLMRCKPPGETMK
jgi:hypothetical protein